MSAPTISAVMIARDEAHNVAARFDEVWDHVDEVVLVDTGSTDGTLAEARRYARRRRQPGKLTLGEFPWREDFAAARDHADKLAGGDWLVRVDLDDGVLDARELRTVAEAADSQGAAGVLVPYVVANLRDAAGEPAAIDRRLYMARADACRGWHGIVDEGRILEGPVACSTGLLRWVRHEDPGRPADLYLPLRERRARREPQNLNVQVQLAYSLGKAGKHARAIRAWRRVFDRRVRLPGWIDGDARRTFGLLLVGAGRLDDAREVAGEAIRRAPGTADAYLTATAIAFAAHDWPQVVRRGRRLLELPLPGNGISAATYTVRPRLWLAAALAELGELEDAVEVAAAAVGFAPGSREAASTLAAVCARAGRLPPLLPPITLPPLQFASPAVPAPRVELVLSDEDRRTVKRAREVDRQPPRRQRPRRSSGLEPHLLEQGEHDRLRAFRCGSRTRHERRVGELVGQLAAGGRAYRVLVLEADGKLAGVCAYRRQRVPIPLGPEPDTALEVAVIAVAPRWRRRGYARELLAEVLEQAGGEARAWAMIEAGNTAGGALFTSQEFGMIELPDGGAVALRPAATAASRVSPPRRAGRYVQNRCRKPAESAKLSVQG